MMSNQVLQRHQLQAPSKATNLPSARYAGSKLFRLLLEVTECLGHAQAGTTCQLPGDIHAPSVFRRVGPESSCCFVFAACLAPAGGSTGFLSGGVHGWLAKFNGHFSTLASTAD
jgi:hypothetical protein